MAQTGGIWLEYIGWLSFFLSIFTVVIAQDRFNEKPSSQRKCEAPTDPEQTFDPLTKGTDSS